MNWKRYFTHTLPIGISGMLIGLFWVYIDNFYALILPILSFIFYAYGNLND